MGIKERIINTIAKSKPIVIKANVIEAGNEFVGKNAIVFGGGSGIGLAIANELKNNGANVFVIGRSIRNIEGINVQVLDVADIERLEAGMKYLEKSIEHIDIVVNSQGICPKVDFEQDFYAVDHMDFENVMKVNVESVYFINQFFCKYFEEKSIEGHILNICSTEGLKGSVVPYGISKSAVVSFTKGFGKRMAEKNITINGIAPGATATKMMNMSSDGDLRRNYIPSHRACIPVEIAKTAHLLLSDVGRQMCGQVVVIDGGESLH